MLASVISGLVCLAAAAGASASQPEARDTSSIGVGPYWVDMPVDHFGSYNATFKNRYWVNATYYKPGGPVVLFDSGEQDASPLLGYYLQDYHGISAAMETAKQFGGVAILWEHRYYGMSLPFPVNANTTGIQYQYLTTEQALEDVVYFAKNFSVDGIDDSLKPGDTPWIWIGGSYPGARGALIRVRNPEIFYAVWASSAVVQAQVDFPQYYMQAERSLARNCSADFVAVTKYGDSVLSQNTTDATYLKYKILRATAGKPGGNATLADKVTWAQAEALSYSSAMSQLRVALGAYQYFGFQASIQPFCDLLESMNNTVTQTWDNSDTSLQAPISSEAGLAATYGIEKAVDAWLTAIWELDRDSLPPSPLPSDPTGRSWTWQYCTEWGYYQDANASNPHNIISVSRTYDSFQSGCLTAFANATGIMPSTPNVNAINKYGGWNMSPSNVLFTNGQFDPWRSVTMDSPEPAAPHRNVTTTIPKCNTPPANNDVFGITHANMVHVSDQRVLLTPDANHTNFHTVGFYSPIATEPFYSGMGLFSMALREWLPCFEKHNV
ncbi:peptidase S28 [Calocera viscosa TUFC12733]|uniref:Peptidase S28 n=1 Tax=Calocera viscosa (strain TUFC12733) TaxID=1330018 RepID=A0A167QTI3_CALVF|nr:peptidase S28 [Calocera viscosa TUFC12733]